MVRADETANRVGVELAKRHAAVTFEEAGTRRRTTERSGRRGSARVLRMLEA